MAVFITLTPQVDKHLSLLLYLESNQNKKTCVWMQSRIHTSFYFVATYLFFPTFRRETMSRFEYFFGRRDFCPLPVGLP